MSYYQRILSFDTIVPVYRSILHFIILTLIMPKRQAKYGRKKRLPRRKYDKISYEVHHIIKIGQGQTHPGSHRRKEISCSRRKSSRNQIDNWLPDNQELQEGGKNLPQAWNCRSRTPA